MIKDGSHFSRLTKNVKRIKKFLKNNKNGLFISDRRSGKTTALLQLLHKNKERTFISVFSKHQEKIQKQRYLAIYDDGKESFIRHDLPDYLMNEAYIDDYFNHKVLYKRYRGAVGSPVSPVKYSKGDMNVNS